MEFSSNLCHEPAEKILEGKVTGKPYIGSNFGHSLSTFLSLTDSPGFAVTPCISLLSLLAHSVSHTLKTVVLTQD